MKRVIICGGRNFDDEDCVSDVMQEQLSDEEWTVITGGASGADSLAHKVAIHNGFATEVYPADWDKYGRSAGPMRNQQMIDTGVDLVIAFPGGRGTAHMVSIAKNKGVRVYEVRI